MSLNLPASQVELMTGILGFSFTVALLSYLIGDNVLYRVALHLFIGVSVGYVTLVVIYQVLIPRLVLPLSSGDTGIMALASVPLVLFVFLVLKLSPRTAPLGNVSMGFLFGVGTAVAIVGALRGTLVPQVRATWLSLMPGAGLAFLNNVVILIGTITTLLTFQFWLQGRTPSGEARRVAAMRVLTDVGQGFLVITLGAIYGGMIVSGIAVFSERLAALSEWLTSLVP